MFQIADGRKCFYQWDINRQIIVEDPTIQEVHFCNKTDDCSLVVEVYADPLDSELKADVPNILLQNDFPIRVYAYCGDGYTKIEETFKVITRTKPSDYVYTETEVKSYEYLEGRFNEIEEKGYSDTAVAKGIEEYFIENPTHITDDGEGNVVIHTVEGGLDLDDYATIEYVDEQISKIDTSEIDLSGYATKEELQEAIEGIEIPEVNLDEYALKTDIPDVSKFITEIPSEYITETELNAKGYLTSHQDISGKADKVHKHTMADITDYIAPDLSNYALKSEIPDVSGYQTEAQVNTLISTALSQIGVAEGSSY